MIFGILKVTGFSLFPKYKEGDFVIVSKIPFLLRGICPGDIVVYDHLNRGPRIKIVDHLEGEGKSVFVVGLHPDSVDSRTFGAIPSDLVLGKVIMHVRRG